MWFTGRASDDSREIEHLTTEVARLWRLVEQLQHEKDSLRAEIKHWQGRVLGLAGIDTTFPAGAPTQEPFAKRTDDDEDNVLGRHVSIMGLRARAELKSRLEAQKAKEKK
jgi:hypothetical protein